MPFLGLSPALEYKLWEKQVDNLRAAGYRLPLDAKQKLRDFLEQPSPHPREKRYNVIEQFVRNLIIYQDNRFEHNCGYEYCGYEH